MSTSRLISIRSSGEVDFKAGFAGTWYTTKATKRDDTNYADAYQYRQGRPLDALWGYQSLGFFKDEDDIKNSPSQTALSGNIKPGDLKYKDQNGDGVIDSKDQVYLGKGGWYGLPTTLGLNLGRVQALHTLRLSNRRLRG